MDRAKRRIIIELPDPFPITEAELAFLETHFAMMIARMLCDDGATSVAQFEEPVEL